MKDVVSAQKSSGTVKDVVSAQKSSGTVKDVVSAQKSSGTVKDIVSAQKSRTGDTRLHCTRVSVTCSWRKQPQPKYSVCVWVVGLVSAWNNRCCVKNPRKC